mgnify:CR=1 FL=1
MELEEYKEWIKQNANQEEVMAYEVAKRIIKYHTMYNDDCEVSCFPRKILTKDRERIEFDLVVKLEMIGKRTTTRLIGIEFKEWDIKKVILQAIVRRQFVDYMYIATRIVSLDYVDLFQLAYFGIGWIVFDEDDNFVKIIVPARFSYSNSTLHLIKEIIRSSIEEIVKEEVEEKLKELPLSKFGLGV